MTLCISNKGIGDLNVTRTLTKMVILLHLPYDTVKVLIGELADHRRRRRVGFLHIFFTDVFTFDRSTSLIRLSRVRRSERRFYGCAFSFRGTYCVGVDSRLVSEYFSTCSARFFDGQVTCLNMIYLSQQRRNSVTQDVTKYYTVVYLFCRGDSVFPRPLSCQNPTLSYLLTLSRLLFDRKLSFFLFFFITGARKELRLVKI